MAGAIAIALPRERIAQFCRRHHIRRLAVFGSALGASFRPDSDLDLLIEFESGQRVGLMTLAGLELELSTLVGRAVDLNTLGCFRPEWRQRILSQSEPLYDAA